MFPQQSGNYTSLNMAERCLSVHHVAALLNISARTVRYLAAKGDLPAFRVGRKLWRFRRSAIENYISQRGGQLA